MKVLCMHLKIFFCVFAFAILLGIITVTPCMIGQKCSICGRSYGFDGGRAKELTNMAKDKICSLCGKK